MCRIVSYHYDYCNSHRGTDDFRNVVRMILSVKTNTWRDRTNAEASNDKPAAAAAISKPFVPGKCDVAVSVWSTETVTTYDLTLVQFPPSNKQQQYFVNNIDK